MKFKVYSSNQGLKCSMYNKNWWVSMSFRFVSIGQMVGRINGGFLGGTTIFVHGQIIMNQR